MHYISSSSSPTKRSQSGIWFFRWWRPRTKSIQAATIPGWPLVWFRDKSRDNKEVLEHLSKENLYTEEQTKHLDLLKDKLHAQHISHLNYLQYKKMVLIQSTSCWFLSNGMSPMYLITQAKHSNAILFTFICSNPNNEF